MISSMILRKRLEKYEQTVLQFHLETKPESAREIVSNCSNELVQSKYIQTEAGILSAKPEMYKSINRLMGDILSFLMQNKG